MKIVIIEDDIAACKAFMDCDESRTDIDIVGMTGKSDEGIRLARNKLPDAIFLDLELNRGTGSGFDFLDKLQKYRFDIRPIIIITTKNENENIATILHTKYKVDFIFCKQQEDYSADDVIELALNFYCSLGSKRSGVNPELKSLQTPEEIEGSIKQRIKSEMDLFYLSEGLDGRSYAEEALLLRITDFNGNAFQEIAKRHRTDYNNILRAVRRVINHAWLNHPDIDLLYKAFHAPISADTGIPSVKEFMNFYTKKIRDSMK